MYKLSSILSEIKLTNSIPNDVIENLYSELVSFNNKININNRLDFYRKRQSILKKHTGTGQRSVTFPFLQLKNLNLSKNQKNNLYQDLLKLKKEYNIK